MILVVALREQRVTYARVAQLVERDLAKVEAAGSSPVSRFFYALVCKCFLSHCPEVRSMDADFGVLSGLRETTRKRKEKR